MIVMTKDACMTQPILETALRRAAHWARRGMPQAAAELLAGTDGGLRYRPEHRDLAASLPAGEVVRVQLSPAGRRVTITRNLAGVTSSRSDTSSPMRIRSCSAKPATAAGSMITSTRSK